MITLLHYSREICEIKARGANLSIRTMVYWEKNMRLAKKIFIWSCPLPLLIFLALSFYLRRYDGWGAWAAAPMLLPPVFLSFFMLIAGAGLAVHSRKSDESGVALIVASLVAGSLFLFLLARAAFMELARSFF